MNTTASLKIAIVGAGGIGTAFAWQLRKAGHDVTVVARGARLAKLRKDGGIVHVDGGRVDVDIVEALDTAVVWDLVLLTVLAPQVAAVLPTLSASAAKTVMFMFNTFEPLQPLQDAVGARFAFGFPGGVFSLLVDGRLNHRLLPGTTVTHASWAKVFADAGITTGTTDDMHGFLRSHAAGVVGMMAAGCAIVASGGAPLSWAQAKPYAVATSTAFRLVRRLGHRVTPAPFAAIGRLPVVVLTALLWALSRTQQQRDLGALGPHEPRMLIDQMTAACPGETATLLAIRP